jgi:hypothetical protein
MNIKNQPSKKALLLTALLIGGAAVTFGVPHVFAANAGDGPLDFPQGNIPLLAPLNGNPNQTLPPSPGIKIFFQYFNLSWPWVLGSAAGIGVLQALVGGMEIMLSGGDSGRRESGKNKLLYALAGLVMIGLASLILETINPTFYT